MDEVGDLYVELAVLGAVDEGIPLTGVEAENGSVRVLAVAEGDVPVRPERDLDTVVGPWSGPCGLAPGWRLAEVDIDALDVELQSYSFHDGRTFCTTTIFIHRWRVVGQAKGYLTKTKIYASIKSIKFLKTKIR